MIRDVNQSRSFQEVRVLAVRRHLFAYLLLTVALLLAVPAVLHAAQPHRQKAALIGWCVYAYVDGTGATVCLP